MKGKRFAAGTIAIATAAAVAVTTILSSGVLSTYAQESFSGLDEIVEKKEYKILEIVPDMSEAKLGLLVAGQESFYNPATGDCGSLAEILSKMTTRAEREAYIQAVYSSYSDIISGSKDSVLSYTSYAESYVPVDGYEQLSLTESLVLGKDSAELDGYYIKDLGADSASGQYVLDAKFIPATGGEDAEALYSQNISYYDVGADNRYYNVEFTLVDTVGDGNGAYQPSDGTLITQEMWEDMEQGELFYVLSDDGASFTLCEKSLAEDSAADDSNPEDDVEDSELSSTDGLPKVANFQSQRFYKVYFSYVAPEAVNTSASSYYYEPYSVSFSMDASGNATGTYGAVLDEAKPYILDSTGGHFVKDTGHMYYMKSENGGRYALTTERDGSFSPDYDVEVDCIYYTGGISSRDGIKSAVFNQSGLLDAEDAGLDITVDAVLPVNVSVGMADEYDLIYLSNSFLYSLKENPSSYAADNDLLGSVADEIYSLVTDSAVCKPVIVDAGILSDARIPTTTNVYKLARLLSSSNLGDNTASCLDDTWTVTYGDLYADANGDSDSYYVNGNVFSVPADGTALAADGLLGSHTFSFLEDFASPFIQQKESFRSEYENFSAESETAFQTTATALGFGEVAGCITDENFIREAENAAKSSSDEKYRFFDLSISRAVCVEYIICYASKRDTTEVDSIQILDIEPCTLSTANKALVEENIKALLDLEESGITVTITHMSSAELISKVEDLCRYDLIYMGLYTDSMNTQTLDSYYLKSDSSRSYPLASVSGMPESSYTKVTETITSYNDTSMDGLVYTNIGDIRQMGWAFAGVLDTDYPLVGGSYHTPQKNDAGIWSDSYGVSSTLGTVRYSGNDLTQEKYEELLDYVRSASPVILADNFLTLQLQEDGTYSRAVNDRQTLYQVKEQADGSYQLDGASGTERNGTIDNCSRMYDLIDDIAVSSTYKNVKTYSEWQDNKSLLNRYLMVGKPVLEVIESEKVEGEEYVKTNGDNVVINFRVKAYGSVDTNASFTANVYVDFNADGRYSKTTEQLDAYSYNIYLVDTDKGTKKKINPVTETVGGKESICYSLPSLNGTSDTQYYSLEYAVQKDYLGIYPVKLVVAQQDNAYRYSYWEGFYYHEKTTVSTSDGTAKEVVKVIQILPDRLYSSGKTLFDMDLTGTYENGSETLNTKYADLFKNKYKTHTANDFYNCSDVDTSLYNFPASTDSVYNFPAVTEDLNGADYVNALWNSGSEEYRWNMQIDTFKNSIFYKYALDTGDSENKLGGYDLQIDSVYASSLVDYFTVKNGSEYEFDDEGYQEFLDYYDMMILGFGDAGNYFSSVSKDTRYQQANLVDHYYTGIHNYIQSGKSVLFTHDTTSYKAARNMSEWTSPDWESGHLSDLLAGDVGFDRYGVYNNEDTLLSLVLSAGIDGLTRGGTTEYTISMYPSLERAKKLGLLAEYDASLTADSSKKTISEATLFDIIVTESDEDHENKDVAYEPNSGQNELTYEVQGRSTIAVNRLCKGLGSYTKTNFASWFNGKVVTSAWGSARTQKVELLNVGQILLYPYNVYDEIINNDNLLTVGRTHYQYFQIDMNADEDNDGESDITVWLSLTDKGNGYNYIEYDVAERDARNNYYIYTKGNVTYSGVGDAYINKPEFTAETQLYINTMIAAYQASAQKPEITIRESADSGSPDKDTIYVSMDSSILVDSSGIGTVEDGTVSLDNDQTPEDGYQTSTVDGVKYWTASAVRTDGVKDSGSYEETYLFVQDTNVTRGTIKNISLDYYLILDSEDDVPDESLKSCVVNLNEGKSGLSPLWAIPLDLETYSVSYDGDGNEKYQTFDEQSESASSGKAYRVDIPYYLLSSEKKRAEVRCYVTTTLTKLNTTTGKTTKISESSSYDSVYLQRISLFDLE